MSLSTKTTKFLVSTVVALGLAGAASATDRTFTAADGNWNVAGNWDPSGVPADGDKAIIPDGKTCHVNINNARADSFEVQSGGLLIIDDNMLLEIDSDSSVAQAQGVQLADSDSKLKVSGNLTLSGAGTLQGKNSAAKIEVASGFTLKNTSTIEGVLQIMGAGTFTNGDGTGGGGTGGVVNANFATGGTLEVASTVTLGTDEDASQWRVGDADATLKFSAGNTGMNGSFYLDVAGVMWFNAVITTSGDLTQEAGTLDVDFDLTVNGNGTFVRNGGSGSLEGGKTFQYAAFSGSQPNPDNNSDSDPPYEVVNAGGTPINF